MFFWVAAMLGATTCYPRCLNTLSRLGPGQPGMGWSLRSLLRHVAFYNGTVLSITCHNLFTKHQVVLSWHLTWKGNPSHPQTEQLCLWSKAPTPNNFTTNPESSTDPSQPNHSLLPPCCQGLAGLGPGLALGSLAWDDLCAASWGMWLFTMELPYQ